MIKKIYADGSAHNDSDLLRPMVKQVAAQIGERIGNTLGPGGRNYLTTEGITNDGVSILKEIRFSDERMDSLADVYEEVARRQDEEAGDGTTTATTFATALTPLVLDDVMDIKTPIPGMKTVMSLKHQLETELETAVKLLSDLKTPISSLQELINVSKTAMEGHPSSEIIAETVYEIGFNANVMLEEGFNGEVTRKLVRGVHMPLSIETPAMFTNVTRKEAEYNNPLVLVVNHVFETYQDLAPFMQGMMAQDKPTKRPIVIIGKQFSVPFTAQVVSIMRQTKIPFLLLGAKGLRDEELIDLAEFLNARYIDTHPKENSTPQQILFSDAGTCEKLLAGPKQTSFTGGDGIAAGRVSLRVEELKKLAETEQNPAERALLLRRSAGLQGGVATIYVDAKTAVDRYYLKKKVEDAVNSCKAALEFGTVAGGGLAYLEVAAQMEEGSYLKRILPEINRRVVANAGGSLTIDPLLVRDAFYTDKVALENAVAVIKILVTIEGVIADKDRSLVDELAMKLNLE